MKRVRNEVTNWPAVRASYLSEANLKDKVQDGVGQTRVEGSLDVQLRDVEKLLRMVVSPPANDPNWKRIEEKL